MYGRETPDELDFADVWESTYTNFICPEYFYHFFFCGIIYSFETEVFFQFKLLSGLSIILMKKVLFLHYLEENTL
jgi:hypothetical protein